MPPPPLPVAPKRRDRGFKIFIIAVVVLLALAVGIGLVVFRISRWVMPPEEKTDYRPGSTRPPLDPVEPES